MMFTRMIRVLISILCISGAINMAYAEDKPKAKSLKAVAIETEQPEIYAQLGHAWSINTVAYSPNGRSIVSGSDDGTLKLWDVASGRVLRTLGGQGNKRVNVVAFSPDGHIIAAGGENSIRLWDVATGRELHTLNDSSVYAITFSNDGRTIVSGSNVLKVWDVASGRELRTLAGHTLTVIAVVLSSDGKTLVSSSLDNTIRLWDIASGRQLRMIINAGGRAVAFSRDGNIVAASSGSYASAAIRMWDVASGTELHSIKGYAIGSLTFTHDGRIIISGSDDGTIKLWDVASGQVLRTLRGHSDYVKAVAISPDGKNIVSGSNDKTLRLWDVASGHELNTLKGYGLEDVKFVSFSADAHFFVSGIGYNTLKLWNAVSGEKLHDLNGWLPSAFSLDGRTIASGGVDRYALRGSFKLWDVVTGRELFTFGENSADATAIVFSPNGRTIVSGGKQDPLKFWDAANGQQLQTLNSVAKTIAFSPDGNTIVSGDGDDLKFWDAACCRQLKTIKGNKKGVDILGVSPDGKKIFSSSIEDIQIWDAKSGKLLRTLLSKNNDRIKTVSFSPDGRILASGSDGYTIKLWDATSGNELRTLNGHTNTVIAVAFSATGKTMLSGSTDGTVRLWDVNTGKEIAQFFSFTDGEWIVITAEGYYNSSANGDSHLNVRISNSAFSIAQYREAFYRPDLVKTALEGGSLKGYRNIASVKPSPQVMFEDVPESSTNSEIKVTIKILDMGGGIGNVRLYLNGSDALLPNTLERKDGGKLITQTYTVKLINGKNSLRSFAFNSDNSMQSSDVLHEVAATIP